METVFFATNRNPVETSIPNNFGTDFSSAGLAWGRALVQDVAEEGDLSMRNMAVFDIARTALVPEAERALLSGTAEDLVVLVHDFDYRFREIVMRAAWLQPWLAQARPAMAAQLMVFSWPSLGSLSPAGYAADRVHVRHSASAFRLFLKGLVPVVRRWRTVRAGRRVHLIAHGLGAAIVEGGIDLAVGSAPGQIEANAETPLFDTAILIQPDVAYDALSRSGGLARLPDLARVCAVYTDSRDELLSGLAARIDPVPRLGHAGPPDPASFADGPWQFVDCSAAFPDRGRVEPGHRHHAWRLVPEIRDDLAGLMTGRLGADLPHRQRVGGDHLWRLDLSGGTRLVAYP